MIDDSGMHSDGLVAGGRGRNRNQTMSRQSKIFEALQSLWRDFCFVSGQLWRKEGGRWSAFFVCRCQGGCETSDPPTQKWNSRTRGAPRNMIWTRNPLCLRVWMRRFLCPVGYFFRLPLRWETGTRTRSRTHFLSYCTGKGFRFWKHFSWLWRRLSVCIQVLAGVLSSDIASTDHRFELCWPAGYQRQTTFTLAY